MSATDFKFAGLDIGNNKVEIGRRTADGWVVEASYNLRLHANTNYRLRLWVDGQVVTLYVDDVQTLSYDYASPLLVEGDPTTAVDPLTDGLIGVGSSGAISRFDDVAVQVIAPEITLTLTDEFAGAPPHDLSGGTWTLDSGRWVGTPDSGAVALSTTSLEVATSALLVVETMLNTGDVAGIAYDLYDADRYKFVVLDAAAGQLVFGHYVAGTWYVDAVHSVAVTAGADHTLAVELDAMTATAFVDGEEVASHTYHSLLNDGDVGMLATGGPAEFERFVLATDDPALEPSVPLVSVIDATVTEGDSGTTTLTVTVELSATSDQDITVGWSTEDGTALAGEDYIAASGTLTIPAGSLTAQITLDITPDTVMEDDEVFWLYLASPVGAIIGDGTAQLTIMNDDVDTVLDVAATDASADETGLDPAVFTITRNGSTDGTLTVTLDWSGTASFGVDYSVSVTGGTLSSDGTTLTIDDGVGTVELTVTPLADDLSEADEDIVLTILPDADYGLGTYTATAWLGDDSTLPALSVGDASVVEGDRGGEWVYVDITLDAASGQTITVEVRTHEDTATANEDFKPYVDTITFDPGVTTVTIKLRIYSDMIRELDETFTVELSNPTNAVIADGVGVVTIIDDEGGKLTAVGSPPAGTEVAPLTADDLAALLPAVRAWWVAQGADPASLGGIEFRIVDLEGRALAVATADQILIDVTAAGFGWFVDTTPFDDGEFEGSGTSAAAVRMDLFSVLLHEVGHVLGHDHGTTVGGLASLMVDRLQAGNRLVSAEAPGAAGLTFDAPSVGSDRVVSPGDAWRLPGAFAPSSFEGQGGAHVTSTAQRVPFRLAGWLPLLLVVIGLCLRPQRPRSRQTDAAHWTV